MCLGEGSPPIQRLTVSNDGHVTDVSRPVHEFTDLRDGESVGQTSSIGVLFEAVERNAKSTDKKRGRSTYLTIFAVVL